MKSDGKYSRGLPDGYLVLVIAEEFGRAPEEVERWDAYWFNRAAEYLQGRSIGMAEKYAKK